MLTNTAMRSHLSVLLPLLTLVSCQSTDSWTSARLEESSAARAAEVDALAEQADIPNIVLGYVTRTGETEFFSYGGQSIEDDAPVDEDTLYVIASMTKALTATAALQLVEAGDLELDEPLEEVFPELKQVQILLEDGTYRPPVGPVTLRHLLTHTSGFAYFFSSPKMASVVEVDPISGMPTPEVVPEGQYDWGFGIQPRRVFDAGEGWLYGRGVGVAGRVVERISGLDLDTYFKRNIFEPLGMSSSGYNVSPELMKRLVPLHMRAPFTGDLTIAPDMRPAPMERFYGGGDLISTPRDYATFLRCLMNGGALGGVRILGSEWVDLFFSDQLPTELSVQLEPFQEGADRTFTDEFDDKHSLAWALEVGAEDGLRPEGVGYWSGIFNTYYTIDNERGVAVFAFSQLLPFDDPEVYELYRTYEDEVYRALR